VAPLGSVAPVSAPPVEGSRAAASFDGLGFVMDVPVELTVELGRKTTRIGEVLKLGPGSVLELNKANGEPLDIYVNNRLIARGEAVVVGERYGVRLTEVLVTEESRFGSGEQK
jgi:flagellar motor switch protein FliN/FliY